MARPESGMRPKHGFELLQNLFAQSDQLFVIRQWHSQSPPQSLIHLVRCPAQLLLLSSRRSLGKDGCHTSPYSKIDTSFQHTAKAALAGANQKTNVECLDLTQFFLPGFSQHLTENQ